VPASSAAGGQAIRAGRPLTLLPLVAGALPAHSLLGLIAIAMVTLDRALLAAIMVGEVAFGIWLVHRVRSGTSDDPA
jgi:hypothetical protein